MRFSFIHAADLHIDSPLAGLGLKDAAVAERFARAGRRAVEVLIEQTIADEAAFLLIAGDIFDGDWKDYASGLFFVRALGRLHRQGIPTLLIKGNHDADSLMSRALDYPPSVKVFASARAETFVLDEIGVAVHGRSYSHRQPPEGFVASYPTARPGFLNIGLLHTGLDGRGGHENYAPCTPEDLRRFGYDYWALGHVHAPAEIDRDPWIVYPGNIQGRSVRETGPKGAVRVTVEDGRIVSVENLTLDAARWATETVDVSGCEGEGDVLDLAETALRRAHEEAQGRPLAVRLTLSGVTHLHARLVAGQDHLLQEARARASVVAEDCWVERLRLATSAPERPFVAEEGAGILDLEALLGEAAAAPEFDEKIRDLVRSVAERLPRDLRDEFAFEDAEFRRRLALSARDHLIGLLEAADGAER